MFSLTVITNNADAQFSDAAKEKQWQADEDYIQSFKNDLEAFESTGVDKFFAAISAERLYKAAQKVNYDQRKAQCDIIVKRWTPDELKRGWIWQNYLWVAKNFWGMYDEKMDRYIIPYLEHCAEVANNEKGSAKTLGNAFDKAKGVKLVAEAVLLVNPKSGSGKKYTEIITPIYDEIVKSYSTKIWTSAFHGENANKIVFSKSPIIIKKENPSAITDNFTAEDNIYAMIYLNDFLKNATNLKFSVLLYVDGNDNSSASFRWPLDNELSEQTYYACDLVPPANTTNKRMVAEYALALSKLLPGVHKVKVEIQDNADNVITAGEFNIDCSKGMDKLKTTALALEDKILSQMRMSKPEMKNPALEKSMMQVAKTWFPQFTPLRVVITEKDWQIVRDEFTKKILYRRIDTEVAYKTDDGNCKIYWLSFKQEYKGAGYGETERGTVGGNERIKCDNISK